MTFQLPWRCIKRLKMNWTIEGYGHTSRLLKLPIYIKSYIQSSWAYISTTGFPNSYRVHERTSHSRDSPTFMSSDTQFVHEFVQIWLICRHRSHLWDCPQLYKFLFNIMSKLNSWYCYYVFTIPLFLILVLSSELTKQFRSLIIKSKFLYINTS